MPITAQSVIQRSQDLLQDLAGTRWPASTLVPHLNAAQRLIRTARPDITATTAEVTLVAGSRQTLPAAAANLIDIPSRSSDSRAITLTDEVMLSAVEPGWRARTPSASTIHFMFDARSPRGYEVYPPAQAGAKVWMEYSAYPADVAAPSGDGKAFSTVSGNIGLPDEWDTALMHVTVAYAYTRDAEYAGNSALAAYHLKQASDILGVQLQASALVAPKS